MPHAIFSIVFSDSYAMAHQLLYVIQNSKKALDTTIGISTRKEGRTMKKLISTLAMGAVLSASAAFAQPFWTGSLYNETAGGLVGGIQTLDWSSSGSGNASGIGPFGTPLSVGQTFDFRYQANLVGVTGPTGNSVTFTGLNTDFEYTVVAKFPEVVASFVPLGGGASTALFSTLPGGTFAIYYDSVANTNIAAGSGFDDGIVVASGTINPGQLTTFTATSLTQGIGSTILEGLVTYVDPLYIDPSINFIFDFRFEGTLNYPPLESTTAGFFLGGDAAFADYLVAANDVPFKVDGSSKFSVVPEPSTMLLLGVGLLGIAGYTRKRIQK